MLGKVIDDAAERRGRRGFRGRMDHGEERPHRAFHRSVVRDLSQYPQLTTHVLPEEFLQLEGVDTPSRRHAVQDEVGGEAPEDLFGLCLRGSITRSERIQDFLGARVVALGHPCHRGILRQELGQDTPNGGQLNEPVQIEHGGRIRSGNRQMMIGHQEKIQHVVARAGADVHDNDIRLNVLQMADQPLLLGMRHVRGGQRVPRARYNPEERLRSYRLRDLLERVDSPL